MPQDASSPTDPIEGHKGLFTNYVISKLTYVFFKIMTQHDAIYLVGSLIMMNDEPSLLSLELALE